MWDILTYCTSVCLGNTAEKWRKEPQPGSWLGKSFPTWLGCGNQYYISCRSNTFLSSSLCQRVSVHR